MIKVTAKDIDTACAAYARATGDTPRREGIRVALHSFNQMTDAQRKTVIEGLTQLRASTRQPWSSECEAADIIEQLLGLP
jgi:hypothetical protein